MGKWRLQPTRQAGEVGKDLSDGSRTSTGSVGLSILTFSFQHFHPTTSILDFHNIFPNSLGTSQPSDFPSRLFHPTISLSKFPSPFQHTIPSNFFHHQVLSPRSESCQAVTRSLEATAAELNALQKTYLRFHLTIKSFAPVLQQKPTGLA